MGTKESTFKPFVISFGDEDFYLDRDIDRAKQTKRRTLCVDGETITEAQLLDLCGSYSEDPRTIILDNANKMKSGKDLQQFIEDRSPQDTSLILVAVVRSAKLPEVWSKAVTKAKCAERKKPKPWEGDKYILFIETEAQKLRVKLPTSVAELLLQFVGMDFYRLYNEVRKLSLLAGELGTVTKEHVALVTTPTRRSDPFQIAEAVLNKDAKKALGLFSTLFMTSGDSSFVPVSYALMREVEKILLARSLQDSGASEDDIAALLGVKQWPYRNKIAPVAKKHSVQGLIRCMKILSKLDADVKGPSRSRTLVEMAILSLAQ